MGSLFGNDPDPRPWFKKEGFMEQDFDCDAYISEFRSFVPLETLRGELRGHLAHLKNELVELINRDYNDFVNFSTKLVDVDSAVLRMRTPLQELRAKLVSVRDGVEGALFALQDALKRRAEASASREILEMLLDTSHVVSKVEKLLHELEDGDETLSSTSPEGGGEVGKDPRSQRLERISGEMNRLKFYVARVADLPFIKNMEKRIQNADDSLGEHLRKCLELGLEKRDERILQPCLRAYVAVDNTGAAEEVFRRTIVAPFVSKIFSVNVSRELGGSGDRLEEPFRNIERHIQNDCKFLLDIASSENSGLHVFNFLGNSILREVVSAIQKGRSGALSPGKPTDFLENYKSSLRFLTFVEGFCKSQAAVQALRLQAGYVDFIKLWNLPTYFSLRLQEIASSLDTVLDAGLKRVQDDGFAFQSTLKLMECLDRCWHEEVFIPALADKFFRLSMQLVSRYVSWLSSGIAARKDAENPTWTHSASAEDYLLLRHDLEVVSGKLNGSYVEVVIGAVGSSAEKLARQGIAHSAQSVLEVVPLLTEVLSDNLSEECIEELKGLKGIFTTYRLTNKPLATRHSHYASNLLQPLKGFLEREHEGFMTESCRGEVLAMVARKVTKNYDQQIRDLVEGARKTETSLLRLRQAHRTQQRSGGGGDSADPNISSTDKVYAQLLLDAEEHGRRLEALGLNPRELPEFRSLWEFVAPPEKQNGGSNKA